MKKKLAKKWTGTERGNAVSTTILGKILTFFLFNVSLKTSSVSNQRPFSCSYTSRTWVMFSTRSSPLGPFAGGPSAELRVQIRRIPPESPVTMSPFLRKARHWMNFGFSYFCKNDKNRLDWSKTGIRITPLDQDQRCGLHIWSCFWAEEVLCYCRSCTIKPGLFSNDAALAKGSQDLIKL